MFSYAQKNKRHYLDRYHRQHLNGNAVELVKTAPSARLRQALINIATRLVVHLLRAIEHIHHEAERSAKILGRLGLARTGWTGRRATHNQMQRLCQRDVAAIGQGCDDQTRLVAQVLVGILELRVADVDEAVLPLVVPPRILEFRIYNSLFQIVQLMINKNSTIYSN